MLKNPLKNGGKEKNGALWNGSGIFKGCEFPRVLYNIYGGITYAKN